MLPETNVDGNAHKKHLDNKWLHKNMIKIVI